jgi:hypothetical protein
MCATYLVVDHGVRAGVGVVASVEGLAELKRKAVHEVAGSRVGQGPRVERPGLVPWQCRGVVRVVVRIDLPVLAVGHALGHFVRNLHKQVEHQHAALGGLLALQRGAVEEDAVAVQGRGHKVVGVRHGLEVLGVAVEQLIGGHGVGGLQAEALHGFSAQGPDLVQDQRVREAVVAQQRLERGHVQVQRDARGHVRGERVPGQGGVARGARQVIAHGDLGAHAAHHDARHAQATERGLHRLGEHHEAVQAVRVRRVDVRVLLDHLRHGGAAVAQQGQRGLRHGVRLRGLALAYAARVRRGGVGLVDGE